MKNFILKGLPILALLAFLFTGCTSDDSASRLVTCDCNDIVTYYTVLGDDEVAGHVEPTPAENCNDGTAIDTLYFEQGDVEMYEVRETVCPD